MKQIIIGLIILIIIGFWPRNIAFANEKSITISPPKTEYTVNAGDTVQGYQEVTNNSDEPLQFVLETQDFVVLDNYGTPTMVTSPTYPKRFSAKSWLTLSPETFILAPHVKQTISYAISVPDDASPGGHYAAIIYKPQILQPTQQGAVVHTSIASLFLISVSGVVEENATTQLTTDNLFQEFGPIHLLLRITNNGDNHIKPTGSITFYSMFGNRIEQQDIKQYNIFPTANRDYPMVFGNTWMIGRFEARFLGTYGVNNNLPLVASVYFWIIPWKLLTIAVFVVVVIILGILVMIKKKIPNESDNAHV